MLRDHPDYHWMRQYHDGIHGLGYRAVADHVRKEAGDGPLTLVGGLALRRLRGAPPLSLEQARAHLRRFLTSELGLAQGL